MTTHGKRYDPFAAGPESEGPTAPSLSETRRKEFRQARGLEEIIRAADKPAEVMAYMMEGNRFEGLGEANELLGQIQEKWNTTPRPELLEHSPKEAAYLIYELPSKVDKSLFDIDLSGHTDAILGSKLFRNWKSMLEYFSTREVRATAKGNLSMKAVEDLKGILGLPPLLAENPEWIRNEGDWEELGILRACAQFAGLLGRRKGKWRASRACAALIAQDSPSAIYLFLFEAYFNRLDWGSIYRREILEEIGFQRFRYLALSGLARMAADWTDYTAFLRKLFIDYLRVRFRPDETAPYVPREEDELDLFFRYPLLTFLEGMNIVETRREKGTGRYSETIRAMRMTDLGRALVREVVSSFSQ